MMSLSFKAFFVRMYYFKAICSSKDTRIIDMLETTGASENNHAGI